MTSVPHVRPSGHLAAGGPSGDEVVLSAVIPVYQAEQVLPELLARLSSALAAIDPAYEIILVDDRSLDRSWEVILELLPAYPRLTAIRLSRNFGQHHAITAGMDVARGHWTVIMDCDLQDQPEAIAALYAKAREGFDIVLARRVGRQDPWMKRTWSALYHAVFRACSGYSLDRSVGAFRIMHRKVVDSFCRMREAHRLFGGLVQWVGFSTSSVEVQHAARAQGRSSYRVWTGIQVTLDGVISFSNRPLYFSVIVGAVIAALSGAWGLFIIIYFALTRTTAQGWPSLMAVTAFMGGLVLFNLGVIGLYLGRVYEQVKGRPLYVVDQVATGRAAARPVDGPAEPRP